MYRLLHSLRKKYTPLLSELTSYQEVVVLKQYFTPYECEAILNIGNGIQLRPGKVMSEGAKFIVDHSLRNATSGTLQCTGETSWIFEKLEDAVNKCNKLFYKFKLIGFIEELQFIRYTPGGHYVWHKDFGGGPLSRRKLSVTLQLTDSSEYEGGEIEFNYGKPWVAPNDRGRLVVFPSFQLHKVNAVKSGMRYVLVGWVNGPPFT